MDAILVDGERPRTDTQRQRFPRTPIVGGRDVSPDPRAVESSPALRARPGRMGRHRPARAGRRVRAMIPAQFDYVRPGNLDETLAILKDREGEAKLLSGGYSLIPLIKLRLAQPALLVDLRDVAGLDGIVETDDYLRIGARATHRQIHEARRRPRRLPAAPRRDRDDRRSAGPQLGHDRRLRRPRRPGLGLARGAHRGATRRSSVAASPASARSRPATSSSTRSRPPSSRRRS